MQDSQALEKAFSDLAAIRRAIEKTNEASGQSIVQNVILGTNLAIQAAALALALLFLVFELRTNHIGTFSLLYSVKDAQFMLQGLFQTGLFLLFLVTLLYGLVFWGAKKSNQGAVSFIARNFAYLKNFSLLCDLLVKYCIFALLLFAGKPEWIAPLLMLFIGDYLLQGRFFTISLFWSLILGSLCVLGAAVQFAAGSALIAWPLGMFCLVAAFSAISLLRLQRKQSAAGAD